MANLYCLMWFEAPLQSWGTDSKFGRRDTLKFPTKSGILGLILCGLGASGPQEELLGLLNMNELIVISYVKSIENRQPLLCDFHMVGSGYDDKDPWQKLLIPKTNEGKPAVGGGAKLTYRYYLQNANFGAILEIPENLSDEIKKSLVEPIYDLYLGRKCCVPTDFIFRGLFKSKKEAIDAVSEIKIQKCLVEEFQVLDGNNDGGDVFTLNDVPVCFGENKKYKDRRVTMVYPK